MPLDVLRSSISQRILLFACMLACAWFQSPIASAQHVSHPHPGGYAGGRFRTAGPTSAPRVAAAAHPMFLRPSGGFPQRPLLVLRRPFFIQPPFLWSWERLNSSWWLYCSPVWGWEDSGCDAFFYPAPTTEHYLAPPLTYQSPVYIYSLDGHPLVQIYLQDGSVYNVNDYWFVDDAVHFTMLDQSGTKSVEQKIAFGDLDVPRTIDVNSRRGFRVVMRDEPIEQYLRDHPDLDPPLLQPSQNH